MYRLTKDFGIKVRFKPLQQPPTEERDVTVIVTIFADGISEEGLVYRHEDIIKSVRKELDTYDNKVIYNSKDTTPEGVVSAPVMGEPTIEILSNLFYYKFANLFPGRQYEVTVCDDKTGFTCTFNQVKVRYV